MNFGHHLGFLKDMDVKIENKGDQLVITIKGDQQKVAMVEKKLNALKELCGCCCCEDECKC